MMQPDERGLTPADDAGDHTVVVDRGTDEPQLDDGTVVVDRGPGDSAADGDDGTVVVDRGLNDGDDGTVVVGRSGSDSDDGTVVVDRGGSDNDDGTVVVDRGRHQVDDGTVVVDRGPSKRAAASGTSQKPRSTARRRRIALPPVEPGFAPDAVDAVGPGAVSSYEPRLIAPQPAPAAPIELGEEATRAPAPSMPSVGRRSRRMSMIAVTGFAATVVVSVTGLTAIGFALFAG